MSLGGYFKTSLLYDHERFVAHALAIADHTPDYNFIWNLLRMDCQVVGIPPKEHIDHLLLHGVVEKSVRFLQPRVTTRLSSSREVLELNTESIADDDEVILLWCILMQCTSVDFYAQLVEFDLISLMGQWSLRALESDMGPREWAIHRTIILANKQALSLFSPQVLTHIFPTMFILLLSSGEPGLATYTKAEDQLAKLCADFPTLPQPSSPACIPLWEALLSDVKARNAQGWLVQNHATSPARRCARCKTVSYLGPELKKCGRCGGPAYCGKRCQKM